MMWLPKMDVVSVQIPKPQFESTRRRRRGDDMPRCKGQVRNLENFENFPEKSAESAVAFGKETDEEIISEEYTQWLVMKDKKEDLREGLPFDYKADPEVAAVKKDSEAVTAVDTMITNNEGFREVEIKISPDKLPQVEPHHFVGKVPEGPGKGVPEEVC